MIEIERKYTVKNNEFMDQSTSSSEIKQGYLNTDPNRTVRVRTRNQKGFLTIKGASSKDGTSRYEFETEIPHKQAVELLKICVDYPIEKNRYLIPFKGHVFEVDVFNKHNEGLVIAEVEMQTAHEIVELPNWINDEITGDVKYYNASLSKHPFKNW